MSVTSNLIKHLRRYRVEKRKFTKSNGKEGRSGAANVGACFSEMRELLQRKPETTTRMDKTVDFIAIDGQPLSVGEIVGYHCVTEHQEFQYSFPGRKYTSETG